MRGDASAYEALGLEPGADQAAIDRAYKTLIKRYHPDREGGDAARASEINHAYFQLRKGVEQTPERMEPSSVAQALYARRASRLKRQRSRKRVPVGPFVLIAFALIFYLQWDKASILAEDGWAEFRARIEPSVHDGSEPGGASAGSVSLEEPIGRSAVVASVEKAAMLHRRGDEDALAEESRECHQKLRAGPTLDRLDRCAAFDDAAFELLHRDPMQDEGPFAASAVTSRQISGATLLSNDYLAIEGRLDRVRSRVQLLLAASGEDRTESGSSMP